MTILQIATQQKQDSSLTLIITIIGAIWALVTFSIGYIDNRLQRRLEYLKTIREYNKDLREWANYVIDLMSTAGHLCLIDPQRDTAFFTKRHNLLITLSAEIDKGRFYLPNTDMDANGQYKEAAYRGFRVIALNHVVRCYDLVKEIDFLDQKKNQKMKPLLMNEKRYFVSAIHEELDPVKFEREMKKSISKGI